MMAELSGVAFQHYQDIEAGRRHDLMLSTLQRIAEAVDVEAWTLLKPDAFPEPLKKRGRSVYRIVR